VELSVQDGVVARVKTFVGAPPANATTVSTRAAVDYLLMLAERSPSSKVGKDAILPTLLADSVEPWPRLLQIARNGRITTEVRKSAIFWLGQAAGSKATPGLKSLLSDDDREVRKSAVFALSQLKGDESVTALIDVVKTSKDREVRKSALFWLGQKDDPRVIALFEDILLKN
jgi:HEAT repeat protein